MRRRPEPGSAFNRRTDFNRRKSHVRHGAVAAKPDELPNGTDEMPETSATVILQVASLPLAGATC